ncbi:hypothetical protein [Halobacillus naozhouensis]|uniref:Uncharacterized protein n=1 Tax=Halobacillus naozhouensis TaxID=554880 RepID=A0ABY8J5I3_9BACI|nr:hypothetical protein [Halobacillus naozhouensis]WFT76211.1 hypothetical protein P9989_07565 [Halobacillus naozhouensis]
MNNLNNYLPQDVGQAARETKCFWDLSEQVQKAFTQGDIDTAVTRTVDLLNTLNNLKYLRTRKAEQEEKEYTKRMAHYHKVGKLAIELEQRGITSAVVRWEDAEH